MSTSRKDWERITSVFNIECDLAEFYTSLYGQNFAIGINIGRRVLKKLEHKDTEHIWPTVMQAEGLDSGLTAGILTAFGVEPQSSESPIDDINLALSSTFGVAVVGRIADTIEDLPPEYREYPALQKWLPPAIVIEYLL